MDESLVFMKTAKGTAEIANRSGALSLMVRRVLIMADGQRPLRELASWVRAGEIENVMNLLESQGFVQRVGGGGSVSAGPASLPVAAVPMPPTTAASGVTGAPGTAGATAAAAAALEDRIQQSFEETRRRALREVSDRLGPDGDHLVQKIERCRTNEELRELVREAERLIAVFYKEVAAQDFIRALRRR